MDGAAGEARRATNPRGEIVQVASELHITGGLRAPVQGERLWALGPVLDGKTPRQLAPQPIQRIAATADAIGCTLFGGDEISDTGTPLLARIWTPLDGPGTRRFQPADRWRAIAGNAADAGDGAFSEIAGHISLPKSGCATPLTTTTTS